jgi:hypothetical protein
LAVIGSTEFLDPSIETFVSEKLIELRVENVPIRSRKRICCDKKFLLPTFFATSQSHKNISITLTAKLRDKIAPVRTFSTGC